MYHDGITACKDQYLIHCNTMDFHRVQPPSPPHTPPPPPRLPPPPLPKKKKKQTSLSVFTKTSFPQEASTKINKYSKQIQYFYSRRSKFKPTGVTTDGWWSPSALSDCHFLSPSPFISFPPFQSLSLSVLLPLHHPLCTTCLFIITTLRCLCTDDYRRKSLFFFLLGVFVESFARWQQRQSNNIIIITAGIRNSFLFS